MMERLKTFFLMILVVGSLWQSYLLAYGKPEFRPINQTEYIPAQLEGTSKDLLDLVFPNEMILHFGDGRHSVLYPNEFFYNEIFAKLTKRTFDSFQEVPLYSIDWDELREERKGIEVTFEDGISIPLLQNVMEIDGDFSQYIDNIDRIWISTGDDAEEVRAYFFSERGLTVYEAAKVDLIVKDVEQIVGWGSYKREINNYAYTDNGWYAPEQAVTLPKVTLAYEQFTPEQMQASLFVDPSISRNLLERDGSEIFTDGKRGLQIDHRLRWMIYSDPVAVPNSGNDIESNLLTAVQFVNQHGGWNGDFLLNDLPDDFDQTFTFRQYYDSYPVMLDATHAFGSILVSLQNGVVSNYERSLVLLGQEDRSRREAVTLPAGQGLVERVALQTNGWDIERVFPAYVPNYLPDGLLELVPHWVVKLGDGRYELLKR